MSQPVTQQPVPDKDARTWGMLCHLSAIAGFIVPFGNVLGPVVVWAIKKDDHAFVNDQGKESINFQLTMAIAFIVSIFLAFLLIGIPLIILLCIFELIMVIVASIKANEGVAYRYPVTIRFFS